jgi:hypothetical protein
LLSAWQQQVISLGLFGLAVYFAVQLARGLAGYIRFLRVRPTALLTWPSPRPAQMRYLTVLGVLGAALAVVHAWLHRPVHHVMGLGLMAVYFLGLVPLARRIRLGLYRDGVWAHRGFLPWTDVGRIAFVETPQVVLLLQPHRGGPSFKLPVPAEEYGAVRKVLEEKARAGVLRLDPAILGL